MNVSMPLFAIGFKDIKGMNDEIIKKTYCNRNLT